MECGHFKAVKHGYVPLVTHWPHSTFHRWWRQMPIYGWMLPLTIGDDNLVTCHSAEHPCGGSALRGLASPETPKPQKHSASGRGRARKCPDSRAQDPYA